LSKNRSKRVREQRCSVSAAPQESEEMKFCSKSCQVL
jgi:hypothetical protein